MTLALYILLAIFLVAPSSALAAKKDSKKTTSPSELYERGLLQMRRGYYTKALEAFNRVRNYHRDDPASVMAQLAIADVHFKKGDYDQARYAYEEFSAYHPRHSAIDYVTYRIGLSIYKRASKVPARDQTATRGAVNVWTGFDSRFPDSEHKDEVLRLLDKSRSRLAAKELWVAKFYVQRQAWGAVRKRAETMLRRYPDTPNTPEALYLMGLSMHSWGQTTEAQQVRDRLATDHPDSPHLVKLDKSLSKPPGSVPEEPIFVRPYRIRQPTQGQQ
ncbi:MAG: outer membrane protein assembly factor BamD [Proteobacteria bacterium]|nr:outer membrane protein assembly factor BamD [Pseudomonadota bacterium]